jgi:pimeloyl-ACP methyl ester carboxylesterase
MLTESSLPTPTVSLNIAEGPNRGPLMLLLHGIGDRWQVFEPALPQLTVKYHIATFDFRGHGRSGRVPGGYTAADFYRDAESTLLHFAVTEPAILLGHSMGGALALQLAQHHPEKVRAVIAGDCATDLKTHIDVMNSRRSAKIFGMRRLLARQQADFHLDPSVLDYHATARVQDFFAGVQDTDLAQIRCPLLLIQANPRKGGLMTDAEFALAQSARPDFSFARLDTAHDLDLSRGWDSPFYQAAQGFLEQQKI